MAGVASASRLVVYSLAALLASAAVSDAIWNGLCTPEPLINALPHGQQLPDSAMAASSYSPGCPAHMARANSTAGCAAWCPASTFQPGAPAPVHDWLQIDLGRVVNISYVETLGRFADGKGSEYVSEYKLQYDRGDGRGFVWYSSPQDRQNQRGSREPAVHVFRGNSDTYNSETVITKYLVAQSIRIVPVVQPTSQVNPCLRVEVYGCQTDGVIAYTVAPQPPDSWNGLSTGDRPYDGSRGGTLHGGLGILTDGDVGSVVSRPTQGGNALQISGHGWVGWPTSNNPVVLTFEFDVLRNFSTMRVTGYDDDQLSLSLFNRSVWQCSHSSTSYPPGQSHVFLPPQPASEAGSASAAASGAVSMELNFGSARPCVGRFVKVEFYRTRGWLLLSEVSFKSTVVGRTAPAAVASATTIVPAAAGAAGGAMQPAREGGLVPVTNSEQLEVTAITRGPARDDDGDAEWRDDYQKTRKIDPAPDTAVLSSSHMIGVFAGAGAGAFVLIVCLVVALCLCQLRIRRRALRRASSADGKHCAEHECEGPLYGGSSSGSNCHERPPTLRHLQDGYNGGYRSEMVTVNGLGYMGLPQKDGIYEEPWSHCHPAERQLTMAAHQTSHGMVPSESVRSYAVTPDSIGPVAMGMLAPSSLMPPEGMLLPSSNYLPGRLQMLPPPPPIPSFFDDKPLPAELLSATIEGAAGNSLMCGNKFVDVCAETLSAIMPYRLGRQCLHFVEKLGEGRFGEIHLCEVLDSESSYGMQLGSRTQQCPSLVLMKILRRDVDDNVRNGFYQELANAAQFRDPNVACVLSAFASDESPYMVVEYAEHGDLHEYLSHRSPGSVPFDPNASSSSVGFHKGRGDMSRGSLVYIACQVASGMKYLENVGVVHRDLAARNVLVGNLYSVKITDIAMSRHRNAPAYCRLGSKALLPVRWMAPESLYTGKFSCRSDVWSFGVLLWEVFTFAQTPYQQLSDEQVVECGLRVFREALQPLPLEPPPPFPVLPRPGNCLKEVYDLMLECWNAAEGDRPAFREIHMFLTRKNVGYDPQQDVAASSGRLLNQEPVRRLRDDSRGSLSSMHSVGGGGGASPGRTGRDECTAAVRLAGRKL